MDAFARLSAINVNDHTEKKGSLTYLSWPWAWGELKKLYPDSYYTVYEAGNGCPYHTDGKTCWVKTGVTLVDGDKSLEHIEYLPVMDSRNCSIPLANVTSFDANKAIQRSLTKAIARHGLGLYIYAGEDFPEDETPAQPKQPTAQPTVTKTATVAPKYNPMPEVEAIKARFHIDKAGFQRMRQSLIDGGIVQNIPAQSMTEADWKQLFRAIEVNFGDVA